MSHDIRHYLKILQEDASGSKIKRDAFLYLAPKDPVDAFAQCSTCEAYIPGAKRCAIIDQSVEIAPDASCGLYVHGTPSDEQEPVGSVSPEEAGLVHRQVRCENCMFFSGPSTCGLFDKLNKALPDKFDLDTTVTEKSCCNAQMPSTPE